MSENAETPVRDPIQERAQITRELLLHSAIRSFTSTGYEASSTRQIETDAGVKRGLIAYHFGTKEALWKAAASWLFQRATEELSVAEKGAANVDSGERMRYFVRAFVRFCARFPEVNRLMIREGMEDDWRLDWLVENAARPWYERVRRLYEEARALDLAPPMEFPHFFYILTGAASLFFSMAPEVQRLAALDPQAEAAVAAHADALAELLFPRDRVRADVHGEREEN